MEYLYILLLVIFSGLFSGMNLGFFSLTVHDLERKARLGDLGAERVLAVRRNGNFLLTTLLLGNVVVNTILSVFLGSVTTGILAVVIATSLIVIFGEIIPQAAFARYAIHITPYFVPLVRICMLLLSPIAWPIAKILDLILGKELTTSWSKYEIADLVENQEESERDEEGLDRDERRLVLGALTYSDKMVSEVMTPVSVAYTLDESRIFDDELYTELHQRGFTRIPVYRRRPDNIIGVLNVKDTLIHDAGITVGQLTKTNKYLTVEAHTKLGDLLNRFAKRKIHLGCIFDQEERLVGLITLEDVIEEILDMDIVDEQDQYVDMRKQAEKNDS